jgi:outer membrane protein assembly factor BamB
LGDQRVLSGRYIIKCKMSCAVRNYGLLQRDGGQPGVCAGSDGKLIALNASTGEHLWDSMLVAGIATPITRPDYSDKIDITCSTGALSNWFEQESFP